MVCVRGSFVRWACEHVCVGPRGPVAKEGKEQWTQNPPPETHSVILLWQHKQSCYDTFRPNDAEECKYDDCDLQVLRNQYYIWQL